MFTASPSRVSLKDFDAILACGRHSEDSDDYKVILGKLFWGGGKAHRVSNRKEEFLSHLPFTEYSEVYNAIAMNPPDPRWDFAEIMREIKEYGTIAKMVMLHVTFWYNPKLEEPHPRKADKKPIYYHLRKPFRKILRRKSHVDSDEDWETKAIALQQVVVDFTKAQDKGFSGKFMIATMKFYQMPKVYHERFDKGKFWDRLAQEIHRKMPEIPFQHSDLLPYNYAGSNIYHSNQRPSLWTSSPAYPEEDVSPIEDLATGEGDLAAPGIGDLIGQEYGSDASSIDEISDPRSRASASAGHEQTSSASTPSSRPAPRDDDQQHLDDDDETLGVDTEYDGTPSPTPPSTSTSLGKRKASNAGHSYQFTPGGRRKSKILKLKLSETGSRPSASASASDASQTLKNGRRDVDYFREQVRRQSFSPSRSLPEPSPSISTASNEPASNPALMSSGQKQIPIDPIPPPRRRKMMTNLPDDMFNTPQPSVLASTANRRGSVRSTSQSPALTAPPAPMFSAVQETAPITSTGISQAEPSFIKVVQAVQTVLGEFADKFNMEQHVTAMKEQIASIALTGISQAEPPLSKVEQAVQIVLEELIDKLTMKEQVAAINAVRIENTASVFVMLPAKLRKAWLYNEIGK